jgi:hypothetical protein
MRTALALLIALTTACTTTTTVSGTAVSTTSSGGGRAPGAIELTLRRADGVFLEVGELRGQVVLLFVLATFDAMSQMALTPLRAIAEAYPETAIVGVAAQPSARLLVEAYESALEPPFPITYDPQERVAEGESMLGEIEGVPTFIVLDRRGREVARHVGFADEARLAELLAAAGATRR